jgi:hypothetical protein
VSPLPPQPASIAASSAAHAAPCHARPLALIMTVLLASMHMT